MESLITKNQQIHYENMPIQIYRKFNIQKKEKKKKKKKKKKKINKKKKKKKKKNENVQIKTPIFFIFLLKT